MGAPLPGRWTRPLAATALLAAVLLLAVRLAGSATLEPADFVFNNGTEIQSLDPATVTGVPEGRILRAIFEGLVTKDPATLEPVPGVAERWERSADGKTWTFFLRPNALWSNGDRVVAQDLEWSFRRFLMPETAAEYAYLLWCVENGREFTTGEDAEGKVVGHPEWSAVGIKALDDATLRFELHAPLAYFLEILAFYPLYPVHRASLEDARVRWPDTWQVEWMKPDNLVVNGPFYVDTRRINDRIRLRKNPRYWDAENVAFDTIDALAVESYGTATNLYLTGQADWLDATVPSNLVPRLMKTEDLQPKPYLGSYFYRVNVTKPPLDDARVRRALALAIPRVDICEKVTKAGQRPALSVVAWTQPRPANPLLVEDPIAEGRRLLREAGYGPGLKPMPALEIHFNTSEVHKDIAEVVADVWKRELGIDATLANQEWKVYLDTQNQLQYDVSRSAWIGDWCNPAPLNFLSLFVTGGENNKTGWGNPRFDQLIEVATYTTDESERVRAMGEAEDILMTEMPALPVYYYVSQNVVRPRLGGFHGNLLNEHFPKCWYWMDDDELAEKRTELPADIPHSAPGGPRGGKYAPVGKARQLGRAPR